MARHTGHGIHIRPMEFAAEDYMEALRLDRKSRATGGHDVTGSEVDYQGSLSNVASQRPNSQSLEQVRKATESNLRQAEQDGRGHGSDGEDRVPRRAVSGGEGGVHTPSAQPGGGDAGGGEKE